MDPRPSSPNFTRLFDQATQVCDVRKRHQELTLAWNQALRAQSATRIRLAQLEADRARFNSEQFDYIQMAIDIARITSFDRDSSIAAIQKIRENLRNLDDVDHAFEHDYSEAQQAVAAADTTAHERRVALRDLAQEPFELPQVTSSVPIENISPKFQVIPPPN